MEETIQFGDVLWIMFLITMFFVIASIPEKPELDKEEDDVE